MGRPLWRENGSVVYSCFWPFSSALILWSEPRGTHDHILLSQIRDSPNLEDQVPVIISPRNRVTQWYPEPLDPIFIASHDSQGCGGDIGTHLDTGMNNSQSSPVQASKLLMALNSTVVLGFGPRRNPWPYICYFQTFTCFEMGPSFWQEEGSDYYWSFPVCWGVTLLPLSLTHSPPRLNSHLLRSLKRAEWVGVESRRGVNEWESGVKPDCPPYVASARTE
jgi:hypothetical protein